MKPPCCNRERDGETMSHRSVMWTALLLLSWLGACIEESDDQAPNPPPPPEPSCAGYCDALAACGLEPNDDSCCLDACQADLPRARAHGEACLRELLDVLDCYSSAECGELISWSESEVSNNASACFLGTPEPNDPCTEPHQPIRCPMSHLRVR